MDRKTMGLGVVNVFKYRKRFKNNYNRWPQYYICNIENVTEILKY